MKLYKNLSPVTILLAILTGINILSVVFFQFITYRHYFHSDAAIKNILAGEILRTGQFFPNDWYYGNGDIWIIFNHIIIIPLLSLFENGFIVNRISGLIYDLLLITSVVYFGCRLHRSKLEILGILAILFTGLSPQVTENLFGETNLGYAWGFIFVLAMLAVVLPTKKMNDFLKNKWHWTGLCLLLILLGMTGIRFLFSGLIPLLIALFTLLLVKYVISENSIPDGTSSLWTQTSITCTLVISICLLIIYGIGFSIHTFILLPNLHTLDISSRITFIDFDTLFANMNMLLSGILHSAGITLCASNHPSFLGQPIISIQGIHFFLNLVIFGVLFFLPWMMLFKLYILRDRTLIILIIFYCSSYFLTAVFFLFSATFALSIDAIRYFTLLHLLSVVIAVLYWGGLARSRGKRLWGVFFTLILALSIFSWEYLIGYGLTLDSNQQRVVKQNVHEPVVKRLLDEGLTHGYASFWHASVTTVLADTKVLVANLNFTKHSIEPFRVLISEAWYRPEFYIGKSFLLMTNEEACLIKNYATKTFGPPGQKISVNGFIIWVYPYNIMSKLVSFVK